VLECVPNVSEGRDPRVLVELASACSGSLLDLHTDPDHHRSVFTLAGPGEDDAAAAVRDLARVVAARVELTSHDGVHPRFGALDVVPFVSLGGTDASHAVDAAQSFAAWAAAELRVPVFLYGDADDQHRTLPDLRRDAFGPRRPDLGPREPHPTIGAVAVGARPVLVAVNCELDRDELAVARAIAEAVRERDGGLPGVRALGLPLASRARVQVSMNLVDLRATGLQQACETVRAEALALDCDVTRVELVGLMPAAELARCDESFRAWAGITADQTIEAQLALRFA
jgi:glutamate formiminotransferase / 5-formyltetrahydrofolate cyclo-ligase